MSRWTRRNLLRGTLRGSAVAVSLPFLDLFLDGNGEALANGLPLPTRFGTWFWGCGVNTSRWFPSKLGAGYDLKDELRPIAPWQDKVTVFSNFNCVLDGRPNLVHWSGVMATLSGAAPLKGGVNGGTSELPTIDCLVADYMGQSTRFRSLELACTGQSGVSYSMRAGSTVNPSEVDPVQLYRRLFGPGFQDPNKAEFSPDPAVMLRKSVLSSVKDDRDELMRTAGAADRQRLEQYFTSVRQVEQQLEHMLEKPAPAEACQLAKEPGAMALGPTWDVATRTHDVMAQLLVMALACNQTRVFNIALSNAGSNLRKPGDPVSFHELTHEEPVDEKLGYQPRATFFIERSMETFASLLKHMDGIREGSGTLLDNSLILATSESNFAKIHSVDNLPILVAGRGGGRWKSGQHISGNGDPSSRVGLTIQQVIGMPVNAWGQGAMEVTRPITEVMA
ncbi:DUF1552 domain-containing protein [Novosphingobium flavum]|uniref:DUF1552 domain-containing protein n=1 Tax=Novosphingobium aerophilum TaxID=2839843 RepID=UPI00163B50D4|nr:DUF1552 domain-containing protein [Novosphingobium aerophilum]MBC2663531.1 DUF1552 domain-containing protein [Novosphingobium aerophilum]